MNCDRSGGSVCIDRALTAVEDLLAIVGPGELGGVERRALRCQRSIALASGTYIQRRAAERAVGRRRTQGGVKTLRRISKSCNGLPVALSPTGQKVPRVGAPCSPLVGTPGSSIEADHLGRCLRATLEGIVDDAAPHPLAPNFLFVLTDDQRYDSLHVMPTVTKLRDEGISFPNAFVTNPACTASRASILTGQHSRMNGVLSNADFDKLDPSTTVANWLSDAGYTNALFGKYLNNTNLLLLTPPAGWSEWQIFLSGSGGGFNGFTLNVNGSIRSVPETEYSTDLMGRRARQFLAKNAAVPFFLVYAPFAPHRPSVPASRHMNSLQDLPLHRPPSWLGDVSGKPGWVRYFKGIRSAQFPTNMDADRRMQLRSLLAVDDNIAELLEELEERGLRDNTVIIFTSDHGIMHGEHWLSEKFNAYEESIRVPLVMSYPRRYPSARVETEMVLNLDLAPSIADLAGVPAGSGVEGRSLVPLLDGTSGPWRVEFLIDSAGGVITRPSTAIRTRNFKYILTDTAAPTEEVYDLEKDPFEQINLALDPDREELLTELRARHASLKEP